MVDLTPLIEKDILSLKGLALYLEKKKMDELLKKRVADLGGPLKKKTLTFDPFNNVA